MEQLEVNNRMETVSKFLGWHKLPNGAIKVPNLFPIENSYEAGWTSELIENLRFNIEWNWIMETIQIIETQGRFSFDISIHGVDVFDYKEQPEKKVVEVSNDDNYPKIEIVFIALSNFCLLKNNTAL